MKFRSLVGLTLFSSLMAGCDVEREVNPRVTVEELKIAVTESPCIRERISSHLQAMVLYKRGLMEIRSDCHESDILDDQRKAVGVEPLKW